MNHPVPRFKRIYLLPILCAALLLLVGAGLFLSPRIWAWHCQQSAEHYLRSFGWHVDELMWRDSVDKPTNEPLLGSCFLAPIGSSPYRAAFHNILSEEHIQLDPDAQYTVYRFFLDKSDYFLEEFPQESTLMADVLMQGDQAVCAVVTWADVLLEDGRFRVTAYARERFGIQWPGGSFGFDRLDPNTYFPADWSLEQIRASFEAIFLADAEARSQAS